MGSGMVAGGMPANKMLHRGDQVDYTRAADVAPGTIVEVGALLVGLDSQGGPNGSLGALAIEGVVDCDDEDSVATLGAKASYNVAAQKCAATGTDIGIYVAVDSVNNRAHVKLIPRTA